MSEIYIYRPDCTDFSTIGECGRLDATLCDCEMVANGMIEIKLEHPLDRLERYRLLQCDWILKVEIPVLTTPVIENGAYVTTVETWKVSAGATKAQRGVYSKAENGSRKKTLKAGTQVTVVSAPATGTRWKIKAGKTTGWMEAAALEDGVEETIEASASGIEAVTPSWELREQTFRIYNVDKADNKITVNAKARSYDLAYTLTTYDVDDPVDLKTAAEGVFQNTLDAHEAEVYTDITGTRVGVHCMDMNPIEALLDPEDGLCARWNAQLVRDEMEFYLLGKAGTDRGLRIEYAQNLTGIHMSVNLEDVFTHVRPIGEQKNGKPLHLTTEQGLVACPNAGSFPFRRIYPLKVSEAKVDKDVSTALARTRLRLAADELIKTGIDAPKVDAKLDYARMGDSPRYAAYRALKNSVYLYDTVHVWHPVLGIDMSAQVVRMKWDCLREEARETDIGQLEDLAPSVSSWQISGGINGQKLQPGTVSGGALMDNVIDARHIHAGSIYAEALQAESVTAFVVNAVTAHINALTAGTITTDELTASIAHMFEVTATHINAQDIETDALAARLAEIAVLCAGTATFDRATVSHLVAEAMHLEYGVGGTVYIRNLAVEYAQMVGAAIGNLCIKASDGSYYQIDVDPNGNVTGTLATVTEQEIAAGQTESGRVILETSITAQQLNTSDLLSTFALINRIDAARIDVDQLFARQAFVDQLNTRLIQSPDFVEIVTGAVEDSVSDAVAEAAPAVLRIDSSRGTVFKNSAVSTVLTVAVYWNGRRITDSAALRQAFGAGAYLQWRWQRMDEDRFGVIVASDSRITDDGFTFTLTPQDVDTKVTFMCELIV